MNYLSSKLSSLASFLSFNLPLESFKSSNKETKLNYQIIKSCLFQTSFVMFSSLLLHNLIGFSKFNIASSLFICCLLILYGTSFLKIINGKMMLDTLKVENLDNINRMKSVINSKTLINYNLTSSVLLVVLAVWLSTVLDSYLFSLFLSNYSVYAIGLGLYISYSLACIKELNKSVFNLVSFSIVISVSYLILDASLHQIGFILFVLNFMFFKFLEKFPFMNLVLFKFGFLMTYIVCSTLIYLK